MAPIFEKCAHDILSRAVAKPVAADTGKKVSQAVSKSVARSFGKDAMKISAEGAEKSVSRSAAHATAKAAAKATAKDAVKATARTTAKDADKAATKGLRKKIAETFDSNGLRKNLEKVQKMWSKQHPKAPTAKALESFADGKANPAVADFVDPIVTYVPKNPVALPTKAQLAQIKKYMASNQGNIKQALSALSDNDRKAFHDVYKMMDSRPDGQKGLVQLLLDGKLSMGSESNPKRNLMQALRDLSNEPLDSRIAQRRTTFVAQLSQELADPVSVSQHYKGTCAATSDGQIKFSTQNPTDYVDYLKGLASPEGRGKLPNGQWVHRAEDWNAGNDRSPNELGLPGRPDPDGGRSISSQLTESSFMQVAMGDKLRYSNTFDVPVSVTHPGRLAGDGGLEGEQEARLLGSIFPGKQFTVDYPTKADLKSAYQSISKTAWKGPRAVVTADQAVDQLATTAAIDNPIPVGVNYQLGGGHAILVTGVQEVDNPAAKKGVERWVNYINPWGQRETQREDAFKAVYIGMISDDGVKGVVGG